MSKKKKISYVSLDTLGFNFSCAGSEIIKNGEEQKKITTQEDKKWKKDSVPEMDIGWGRKKIVETEEITSWKRKDDQKEELYIPPHLK